MIDKDYQCSIEITDADVEFLKKMIQEDLEQNGFQVKTIFGDNTEHIFNVKKMKINLKTYFKKRKSKYKRFILPSNEIMFIGESYD